MGEQSFNKLNPSTPSSMVSAICCKCRSLLFIETASKAKGTSPVTALKIPIAEIATLTQPAVIAKVDKA